MATRAYASAADRTSLADRGDGRAEIGVGKRTLVEQQQPAAEAPPAGASSAPASEPAARPAVGPRQIQLKELFPGAAVAAKPIQCYREIPLDGAGPMWRLSQNEQMLVGPPVIRSHDCFAAPQAITTANHGLQTAGSFIRLEDAGGAKQIKLRENGQNAAFEDHIQVAAYHRAGGSSPKSHDDNTAHYFAGQNQLLERREPTGVDQRALELAGGGPQLPAHRAQALDERRAQARHTDRSITLNRVRPRISPQAPQTGGQGAFYNQLRNHGGNVKLPADCNEAARVIMGVATRPNDNRVEQAVRTTGGQQGTYGLHEMNLVKGPMGNASQVERGGLTALRQQLIDFANVVRQRTLQTPPTPAETFLLQQVQTVGQTGYSLAWQLLHQLQTQHAALYREFTRFAGIDAAAMPQVGEALVTYRAEGRLADSFATAPRLHAALTTVLNWLAQLHQPANPDAPAIAALLLQLAPGPNNTLFPLLCKVADAVVELMDNAYNRRDVTIGNAQSQLHDIEDKKPWNKHWGGVVMTDGSDYLTLENDASTDRPPHGPINDLGGFGLYGSVQPEQSFHHQMMESGEFGNFASTERFQRPLQQKPDRTASPEQTHGPALAPPGAGAALPGSLRPRMERAFETDFSDVRVHHGAHAQALGAAAYTQGTDLHFAPGKYDPTSKAGETLLAHELAHVVQQRDGRVAAPQGAGAPVVADASLETEADVMADRVVRGERARGGAL